MTYPHILTGKSMAAAAMQPADRNAKDRVVRNTEEQELYIPLTHPQPATDS